MMTISKVLLDEIFLVQLFSKPQQTLASKTNSEPREKRKLDNEVLPILDLSFSLSGLFPRPHFKTGLT